MTGSRPIRVCVVTASRAEYGLMRWMIHDLLEDSEFATDLVVTGTHLSPRHGHTVDEIIADGVHIGLRIPLALTSDVPSTLARAMGDLTSALAQRLVEHPADIALVLGDRWELLPIAGACLIARTPIGHFSGGEITEGSADDSVRHAVTKLSHLHFVANDVYAVRVRSLGEEDWRVCVCGGPGIDNFRRLPLPDRATLSAELGIDLTKPTAVVTFHPPTLSAVPAERQVEALLDALRIGQEQLGLQYVITGPNAEFGADAIEHSLRNFVAGPGGHVFVPSLGTRNYLSILKHARLMIGNSSSAFHEAPLVGLLCVDVGDRQRGRLSGGNVINVDPTVPAIVAGMEQALNADRDARFTCPYGTGETSTLARTFLKKIFEERGAEAIWRKRFVDRVGADR